MITLAWSFARTIVTEQQWRSEPDEQRPASERELSLIIRALDRLISQPEMLGSFAIINLETGECVTGRSLVETCDDFQSKFSGARGFVHCVGEPLYEPVLL